MALAVLSAEEKFNPAELNAVDLAVAKSAAVISQRLAEQIGKVVSEAAGPLLTHINKHANLRGKVISLDPQCGYCRRFFSDLF